MATTPPSFNRSLGSMPRKSDAFKANLIGTARKSDAFKANMTKNPVPGQPGGMIPPPRNGGRPGVNVIGSMTSKNARRKGSPRNMDLQQLAQSRLKRMR